MTRSISARREAGERVGSTADDIRSVGEELRRQGKDQPAKLAEQAAQRAESLGDYLQRSDGDTILRDVEDFGRRQPWAVIAGGLVVGFAASRFLKASSERRSGSGASPTTTRDLTAGAPTSRTGLAADDVTRREGYGTNGGTLDDAAPPCRPGSPGRVPAAGLRTRASTPSRASGAHRAMATHDPVDARERGIGELVKDLASQTSTLVRQEIQLAQAEVTQKGKLAGKGAGMLAGAGVAALLGLGALTALVIVALDGALALWLAALIVTVLWLAVAGALAMAGKKALRAPHPLFRRPLRP